MEKENTYSMQQCNICIEINGNIHPFGDRRYNTLIKNRLNIIWMNESFTLIPSIGPLNEGHILIVPNNHISSFHYLNVQQISELEILKNAIRNYNFEKFNQDTEFFEHGTGTINNYCGSCVAHAHLHALPVPSSINKYLTELKLWKIDKDYIYDNQNVENGYLSVEDVDGQLWYNNKDLYPSQVLRKYYYKYIFSKEKWNWRTNPNILGVIAVIGKYKDFNTFI